MQLRFEFLYISVWLFQVDLLPEISQSPRILSEVDAALKSRQMKTEVDEYLKVQFFKII